MTEYEYDEVKATEDGMPEPVLGTQERPTLLQQALAPSEEPAEETEFEQMLAADAPETVTLRYSGWADYIQPPGFGKFWPDTDYEMSEKCANYLLGLKNPDGTYIFEKL